MRPFCKRQLQFQLTHPSRGATILMLLHNLLIRAFQLTHPSRGATSFLFVLVRRLIFQLTHPSRGATQGRWLGYAQFDRISTHTPLAGCDAGRTRRAHNVIADFNSHTPRGVRLVTGYALKEIVSDFNSHTPRGVRRR